jgi:hypothetical protein
MKLAEKVKQVGLSAGLFRKLVPRKRLCELSLDNLPQARTEETLV